jgi:hypothetical protein
LTVVTRVNIRRYAVTDLFTDLQDLATGPLYSLLKCLES